MKKIFVIVATAMMMTVIDAEAKGGGGGLIKVLIGETPQVSWTTVSKGKEKVTETLKSKGYYDIKIISNKPMKVVSKRARVNGTEFAVTAVKGGETNNLSVFVGTESGVMMYFKGEKRVFLE